MLDCELALAFGGSGTSGWRAFLDGGLPERDAYDLRRHERNGRPLGETGSGAELEELLGRQLRQGKRGRRKGSGAEDVEVN